MTSTGTKQTESLLSAEIDETRQRRTVLLCLAILGLAAACRIYASLDDFWLDEIWSWEIARSCSSAWEILVPPEPSSPAERMVSPRLDNNHVLNTWILYFLGPDRYWLAYRIPAVLAGVGTVILAGLIGARTGRVHALTTLALTGGSYLLILYSSEARGYAYVTFFSMASLLLMSEIVRNERWWLDVLFGVTAVFGFLSHLTYLYCYAAIVVWSAFAWLRSERRLSCVAAKALRCHLLPTLFLSWLYAVNISRMIVGGGQQVQPGDIAVQTLSLALGGPESGTWVPAVSTAAVVILLAGLLTLWRAGSDQWLLFLMAIVAGPALLLWTTGSEVIYPRYFIVSALFLLILTGDVLSRLYRLGRSGRTAYALLLAAFLAANGFHTWKLVRVGRGGYLKTASFVQEHTNDPVVTLGSDHDFRNFRVFEFYLQFLADPKPVRYFASGNWPPEGPEWLLLHSQQPVYVPKTTVTDKTGNRYRLAKLAPYAGLSGWHWALYHNENRTRP